MEETKAVKAMKAIEDSGLMVEPFFSSLPLYDTKKLREYRKEKGIKPEEITEKELEMFLVWHT